MRDALDTARNNSHNVALDRRKTLPDRSQTREKAAGDEDVQTQTHHPDRKDLRQLAQRTCSMLTQSGVEHWLDFGSLLGLMREGNILEGDTDVDISVIDTPENVEKLENSRAPLADMGIFLKKELTWNAYRAASSLGYVHLYLTELVNHTYQGAIGEGSEISSDLIGTPTLFDWQGTQVAIPQHTHAFLVARYGDDYMDPDAFYANKSFLGRHPGSDGWNQLVLLREQKLRARMTGRVADAVQETTAKLALQPAPQPAAQPAVAARAPAPAPMAAVQQLGLSGPDLAAASATLSRHLVSYERRMKDNNNAHDLAVRADSDRSAMALDNAVQHHKQACTCTCTSTCACHAHAHAHAYAHAPAMHMPCTCRAPAVHLPCTPIPPSHPSHPHTSHTPRTSHPPPCSFQVLDNLQAQYDLTTHPATRARLQSQITQHQESAARAEAEAAALAVPQAPAAALPQATLYRKSGAARGSQNIAKQQALARGHTLAPNGGATLDGLDSSNLPRSLPAAADGAPPPLGSREGWAAPSWAAAPAGAAAPGWASSGARSEGRARSEQKLRNLQSEVHTSERDAHSLARKAKDAAHEKRLHEYAERVSVQADSDRAALALGATKQHETELVDNLENRFASTTDAAARELLRSQISSHREAAARASLEAETMHGSEERHNGLTRDKMSQARTKRLLLRAERPSEDPGEDLLHLVRQQ